MACNKICIVEVTPQKPREKPEHTEYMLVFVGELEECLLTNFVGEVECEVIVESFLVRY